ncbi:hypothetical protein V3481_019371 [Fusarium oxysporum f. sp. vasinfectum]
MQGCASMSELVPALAKDIKMVSPWPGSLPDRSMVSQQLTRSSFAQREDALIALKHWQGATSNMVFVFASGDVYPRVSTWHVDLYGERANMLSIIVATLFYF